MINFHKSKPIDLVLEVETRKGLIAVEQYGEQVISQTVHLDFLCFQASLRECSESSYTLGRCQSHEEISALDKQKHW